MKNSIFVLVLLMVGISFTSCEDFEYNYSNTQLLDTNQTLHNDTLRLITTQNNNFNNWETPGFNYFQTVQFVTRYQNDYSDWYIYLNDGGGNISQVNNGNCNRWQGMINNKVTASDTITINTRIENDYNEWIYEENDFYHLVAKYYIRTNQRDDFNSLSFYDEDNVYLFKMNTSIKNNFNKWDFKDLDNSTNYSSCLYFVPVILTVSQHY